MGWFSSWFGGGTPPAPKVSRIDALLQAAVRPSAQPPCVATEEDGRVVALYLADAEHLTDEEWEALLTHDRVNASLRSLDLVLLHDGPKAVVGRVVLPALKRLVVGSLAHDIGDHAHTINNLAWGSQGVLPALRQLAPALETVVLRGVEAFGPLPPTVRSLQWTSLASTHPDDLDLGPEGTLAQLRELVLIEAPQAPFAARADLSALERLVVTPDGLPHWAEATLPALTHVEVLGYPGIDQDTIDALAALRDRTGAEVVAFSDPEAVQVDDERGVPVRYDIDEHPLRWDLEMPG